MKISIVTATYNSSETMRDTFNSILAQTYSNYELIVIDGGSTDETVSIIKEYEPRFEGRMRWVSEHDGGIYDAMNKGIDMATGDVVGLLNSDDYFSSPDVLGLIAEEYIKNPDFDAVYGDVRYVKWNDTDVMCRYYSSRHFRRSWMRMGFMPAHPAFYCKKNVYERFKIDGTKIKGFRGNPTRAYFNTTYKIAADFDFLLRIIFIGKISMKYVNICVVNMRVGGISSSGVSSHLQINKDHMRAFKENDVYSNYFLISLRYLYKIGEVCVGRLLRLMQKKPTIKFLV